MGTIDLNADLGETEGDLALLEVVTSANIACGGHAGDASTMERAVREAGSAGVAIGAHPSYEDREGFGRRELALEPAVVARQVAEQVEHLSELATVRYVKLHGALYHRANEDCELADAVLDVLSVHHVLAQPGALLDRARARGWSGTEEGFGDRRYTSDGRLVDRREDGAVLEDPDEVAAQALRLAGQVGSLCVHGDTPGALEMARRVRAALESAGHELRPFA